MFSITISRRDEYKPGDLGLTIQGDDTQWLVEVQSVHNWGYDARLTRLSVKDKTGRHIVECVPSTYGRVPRDELRKFRLDNIDFESLAAWQRYVDTRREER